MEKGEIILYQPDETVKLEVHMEDETVWLTQAQMVELLCSTDLIFLWELRSYRSYHCASLR